MRKIETNETVLNWIDAPNMERLLLLKNAAFLSIYCMDNNIGGVRYD